MAEVKLQVSSEGLIQAIGEEDSFYGVRIQVTEAILVMASS